MTKFAVPTIITLISRTRAGGTVFVIVVAVLALAVLRSRPSSPSSSASEPVVRRTDLGAKGIYYRATVVPFAPDRNTRERH